MRGSWLRVLVVVACLFVLTNGLLFLLAREVLETTGNWEDPVVRSPIVATSLLAFGLVALDGQRVSGRRLARPSVVVAVAIAVYSVVAVVSTNWSLAPDLTLWRSFAYLGLPFLAWVVADLDDEQRWRAVAIVSALALGASLAMLALSSSIALDRNDDWRGIYTNRNSLAPLAALGVVSGLVAVVELRARARLAGAALGVASVVVLLGTGSRTAWLALLVALGVGALVAGARLLRDRRGASTAAFVAGAAGVVGLAVLVVAISRLWSESTFEQRRTIWSLVWDRIAERPIHGHGFFAVWDVPEFVSAHPLLERGSAHGSTLEVWLGLGLIGLVPFAVIVVAAAVASSRALWRRPSPATWGWFVMVLFLMIENITESFVLWFSYNWVIVMAAALGLGMEPRTRDEPGPARGSAAPDTIASAP